MRITEQIRLAWRTMRWADRLLPLMVAVVGCVCLFLGGEIHFEVIKEKSEPCEVTVTPQGGSINTSISGEVFRQVQSLEDVLGASYVWTFPVNLQFEEYAADVTLCGIDASYLSGIWLQGAAYPEDSAMPYLVLNEAAIKAFRDEKNIPPEQVEGLNWSAEQMVLQGTRETNVRICGVLQDGKDAPIAYLSQTQVKNLRMEAGMESPADTLWLRLKDSGVRSKVAKELGSLGLQADAEDAREADWNLRLERRNLFGVSGLVMLICSALVMVYQDKLWKKKENPAYAALMWLGIPQGRMRTVVFWRWIILYVIGGSISAGILAFMG